MSTHRSWFDFFGAACGLVVFAPIIVAVAVAIWWDDGGPVLFRQARVGRNRRPFTLTSYV